MFKEMKSRRLALLVAVTLGGGGFLSSAQNVSAADVTENNVEIDGTGNLVEGLRLVRQPGMLVERVTLVMLRVIR